MTNGTWSNKQKVAARDDKVPHALPPAAALLLSLPTGIIWKNSCSAEAGGRPDGPQRGSERFVCKCRSALQMNHVSADPQIWELSCVHAEHVTAANLLKGEQMNSEMLSGASWVNGLPWVISSKSLNVLRERTDKMKRRQSHRACRHGS